jgi:hypothetical protein
MKCVKCEQHNTGGNADISHIEDTGAEGTNAEVHEVDHAAIIHDAIQEIAQPTAQHETPGNGSGQWYLLRKENHRQGGEAQGREYLEEQNADPLGETSAEAQESAGVLCILEANRIIEPRLRRLEGQVLVGDIFRELITTHTKDEQQKNQQASLESGHDSSVYTAWDS